MLKPIGRTPRASVVITPMSKERACFLTSFRLLGYLKKKVSDLPKLSSLVVQVGSHCKGWSAIIQSSKLGEMLVLRMQSDNRER
jgi:hypothetical protein